MAASLNSFCAHNFGSGGGGGAQGPATQLATNNVSIPVTVNGSAPPTAGYVLIATSNNNATWQAPATLSAINDLRLSGNVTNTAAADGDRSIAIGRYATVSTSTLDSLCIGSSSALDGASIAQASRCIVIGNYTRIESRSFVGDSAESIVIGNNSRITNAGGSGNGALPRSCVVLGVDNLMDMKAGSTMDCGKNTMLGFGNTFTGISTGNTREHVFVGSGINVSTVAGTCITNRNVLVGTQLTGTNTGTSGTLGNNVVVGAAINFSNCDQVVVIGTGHTVQNQIKSISIGRDNDFTSALASESIMIGNANRTTPTSLAYKDILIGFGNTNTCSGAGGNGCILIGRGISSLFPGNVVLSTSPMTIPANSSGVYIGTGLTPGGTGSVAIGSGGGIYANGTGSVCVGANARASFNGVAIGNQAEANVIDSGTGAIAIGYDTTAAVTSIAIGYAAQATSLNSCQLGTGTANAGEFKFLNYQIHDGQPTYMVAPQPLFKDPAGNYIVGTTTTGQDYWHDRDPQFNRDSAPFVTTNGNFGSTCQATFAYRDGFNLVRGYPWNTPAINLNDLKLGPNKCTRLSEGITTDNTLTFIPAFFVPASHYVHARVTVVATRIATYDQATDKYGTSYCQVGGGGYNRFIIDQNNIGGKSWDGNMAVQCFGPDATRKVSFAKVSANFAAADVNGRYDIAGDLISGVWGAAFNTVPIVGPTLGAISDIAVGQILSQVSKKFDADATETYARMKCDMNNLGDLELQRLGAVTDVSLGAPGVTVGIYVRGKDNYRVDWRIVSDCVVVPFADPAANNNALGGF